MNILFCRRQQNNFRYRKYTYRIILKKKLIFNTLPVFKGCRPGDNLLFTKGQPFYFPLHYISLGCSPGCLPRQQIFRKTSKLSYYFIVCGLFEWKQICAGFYRLFIYVLPLENHLSSYQPCHFFVPVPSQGLYFNVICRGLCLSCIQWVKMKGDCSFCWYCWNCLLSLFKLSFHNWLSSN